MILVLIIAITYFFGATLVAHLMKKVEETENETKNNIMRVLIKAFLSWPLQVHRMEEAGMFNEIKGLRRMNSFANSLFLLFWLLLILGILNHLLPTKDPWLSLSYLVIAAISWNLTQIFFKRNAKKG